MVSVPMLVYVLGAFVAFVGYVSSAPSSGKRREDMVLAGEGLLVATMWPLALFVYLLTFVVDAIHEIRRRLNS